MIGSVKKGDTVFLHRPGSSHVDNRGGHIKEGTEGRIVATRELTPGKKEFLVKFVGHGGPRHCAMDQLKGESK